MFALDGSPEVAHWSWNRMGARDIVDYVEQGLRWFKVLSHANWSRDPAVNKSRNVGSSACISLILRTTRSLPSWQPCRGMKKSYDKRSKYKSSQNTTCERIFHYITRNKFSNIPQWQYGQVRIYDWDEHWLHCTVPETVGYCGSQLDHLAGNEICKSARTLIRGMRHECAAETLYAIAFWGNWKYIGNIFNTKLIPHMAWRTGPTSSGHGHIIQRKKSTRWAIGQRSFNSI